MKCDASWLPESVVADSNTIQMPTLQVHVWAVNAGVGVSHCAAETMGNSQAKGCWTTQQKDNNLRERI